MSRSLSSPSSANVRRRLGVGTGVLAATGALALSLVAAPAGAATPTLGAGTSATQSVTLTKVEILGGSTSVTVPTAIVAALTANHIAVAPSTPASVAVVPAGAKFAFPITTSAHQDSYVLLDSGSAIAGGNIWHNGGLVFTDTQTGHSVKVGRFLIDLQASRLTGAVNDQRLTRIPLFNLVVPNPVPSIHNGVATVSGVKLLLTAPAAAALNLILSTTLFTPGLQIGTATVKARI